MSNYKSSRVLIAFCLSSLLLFFISGCAEQLMATPNLYKEEGTVAFDNVPADFQRNTVDILYATDRKKESQENDIIRYGYERSESVAYGSCVVKIGNNVSWEQLVRNSLTNNRDIPLNLSIIKINETGRFVATPYPMKKINGEFIIKPEIQKQRKLADREFHRELIRRLAKTSTKEAYIFIHGFHTKLEDASYVMAGLWHFLERRGVPIVYSWPAGKQDKIMKAYAYDRESGEFTVYHLKEFLRSLSSCPELEKIHLICHSRGTDVGSTALRELVIAYRGAGLDPQKEMKLGNVIMAAADIDVQVALQRISTEQVFTGFERCTIYVSEHDRAIWAAQWLYGSERRIGNIKTTDVEKAPELFKRRLIHGGKTQIVKVDVDTGFIGHSYFYSHPAVSSDVVLILRDNLPPGTEHDRPLQEITPFYWVLHEGYPLTTEVAQR